MDHFFSTWTRTFHTLFKIKVLRFIDKRDAQYRHHFLIAEQNSAIGHYVIRSLQLTNQVPFLKSLTVWLRAKIRLKKLSLEEAHVWRMCSLTSWSLDVVYSPTKVVLTLIELHIDSLTVSPFFAAKNFYEELDINNIYNYEFDWIHPFESLTVIRFSCSEEFIEILDNNDIGRAFAKSNGFRFKLFCGISTIFGRETSFSLNWMNPIENLTIISFLCREKLIKLIRNRLLTVI